MCHAAGKGIVAVLMGQGFQRQPLNCVQESFMQISLCLILLYWHNPSLLTSLLGNLWGFLICSNSVSSRWELRLWPWFHILWDTTVEHRSPFGDHLESLRRHTMMFWNQESFLTAKWKLFSQVYGIAVIKKKSLWKCQWRLSTGH